VTDRSQTHATCRTCEESTRYDVSGKPRSYPSSGLYTSKQNPQFEYSYETMAEISMLPYSRNRQRIGLKTDEVAADCQARRVSGRMYKAARKKKSETPRKFSESTSWTVFHLNFEVLANHHGWTSSEKPTDLLAKLEGRDADMLHCSWKQLADDCLSVPPEVRITVEGESWQESAAAIEQLPTATL